MLHACTIWAWRKKMLHCARRSWTHLFCIHFAYVIGKDPKTHKLSPAADNAITRGGIGGLGSVTYSLHTMCASKKQHTAHSTFSKHLVWDGHIFDAHLYWLCYSVHFVFFIFRHTHYVQTVHDIIALSPTFTGFSNRPGQKYPGTCPAI